MSVTVGLSLDDELRRILTDDVDAIQDPFPVFRRLREESALYRYDRRTVIVSRHRDVKAGLRDNQYLQQNPVLGPRLEGQLRLLSAEEVAILEELNAFDKHAVSRKDGVEHARVRHAAHRYFTPKRVADFEPIFQRIFDELIEEWAGEDSFDFMRVAYKLPLLVITEILGVPRADAEMVKAWGDSWLITQNPIPPEAVHRKRRVLEEYRAYVRQLVQVHRADPNKSDLIASVLDAADENRLSDDELVMFFMHTLFAGHETTQHMIANGLRALLLHREQWQMICEEPVRVPDAVEEIMRWDPPLPFFAIRRSADGAEVAGVPIDAGLTVLLMVAGSNRDPDVFDSPDAFDITRRPNDHLSLGFGPHFCLGASLARLEGRIVFDTLTRRYPNLDFAVDPTTLRYRSGIRGLNQLPICLGRQETR